MRILIVSHNVFSRTSNMGKTLMSYFMNFASEDLAQFYIHCEVPTSKICKNYYRVTDKEMIKSFFGCKTGKVYQENDIEETRDDPRVDIGIEAKIYRKVKRTPLVYIARNLWWRLGRWNNKKFRKWLDEFNPEGVFFVSGDYAFMYKIALKIAKKRNIPLFVSCMDDYYLNNKTKGKFLGNIHYQTFMKSVHKTMQYASIIFCICKEMCFEYKKLFQKNCVILHTSASFISNDIHKRKQKISYIGNLGLNRNLQLIAIGRALKKLELEIDHIDVYSTETRKELLDEMKMENGIVFHGAISSSKVREVMDESAFLIHTESFDEAIKNLVRFSVSTKIADSLMSGACLLAYGPSDIASITYLKEYDAAYCITEEDNITKKLKELFLHMDLTQTIIKNAIALAKKNHYPGLAGEIIKENISRFNKN